MKKLLHLRFAEYAFIATVIVMIPAWFISLYLGFLFFVLGMILIKKL